MDALTLQAIGDAANHLGPLGFAMLCISGLAWAVRTLWKAYQQVLDKSERQAELILELERESQRLLTRFEDAIDMLRSTRSGRRA